MTSRRLAWYGFGIIVLAACDAGGVAPPATVYFVLDAPLCSSQLPVQFFIDSAQVGTDTFRVNLAPDHTTSAGFEINSGMHTLGARVVNGYVWSDRAVRVAASEVVHDSLPFYCS